MKNRDTLYLLPPGFFDNNRREYCPECAEIWGLLSWFPALRETLNIEYMPIDKPRPSMVEILGDKNQNCPTLVLADDSPEYDNMRILTKNGYRFMNNARDIGKYYCACFGIPTPRGS